ncbi:MAG: DUF1801 domain-containing protein [Chloroflexi bacterium]|nr:DUF1801 domain-containing protein [Chloroflexota bacterium]
MAPRPEYKDIDEYIAAAPKEVQPILRQVRRTIRKAAPEAKETISYRIPAYMLNGPLVYFAAFPDHISLYPAPRGAAEFTKELAAYKGGKGTVQFPLDKPIPFGLITRVVKFRMKKDRARAAARGKKK